jgi:hypothetical protein
MAQTSSALPAPRNAAEKDRGLDASKLARERSEEAEL